MRYKLPDWAEYKEVAIKITAYEKERMKIDIIDVNGDSVEDMGRYAMTKGDEIIISDDEYDKAKELENERRRRQAKLDWKD